MELLILLVCVAMLYGYAKFLVLYVRACARIGNTLGNAIVNAAQPRERCLLRECAEAGCDSPGLHRSE